MLLDFEAAAIGPREWDLLPTAIACERYRPGRGAVPGVRRHLRVRRAHLGRLPGAAGDPRADDDDLDHAERRWSLRRSPPSSPCESPHCGREISSVPGTSSDQPGSSPAPADRSRRDHPFSRRCGSPTCTPRPGIWRTAPLAVSCQDYLRLWRFEQLLPAVRRPAPAGLMPRGAGCQRAEVPALAARRRRDRGAGLAVPAAVGPDRRRAEPGRALRAARHDRPARRLLLRRRAHRRGTPVEEYAHAMAVQLGADGGAEHGFLPERHQIVFGASPAPEDCEDLVQRLIYRDRPAVPQGIQRDPLPGRAQPPPGLAGRRRPVRERGLRPPGLHRERHLRFRRPGRRRGRAAARDPPGRLRRRAPVPQPRSSRRAPPGTAAARWNGSPTSSATWNWNCPTASKPPPTSACSFPRCGWRASTTRCMSR